MTAEEIISAQGDPALPTQPTHLLDLLKTAASSDACLLFLEDGSNGPATKLPYAQLYEKALQQVSTLRASGLVEKGQVALTYFDNHYDNVVWFWSVVAAGGIGAILSPLSHEPKTASGQLENVKNLFGDAPLITSAKLAPLFAGQGLQVKTIDDIKQTTPKAEPSPVSDVLPISELDSIAAILFTSGSTGHSKAVQYSHKALLASVKAKADHLDSRGRTFMSWVSFDHSANFCEVHLQSMYVCSDQVLTPAAELMAEPYHFFSILSAYKVGYTFTPNFFLAAATKSLRDKLANLEISLDLSHLRTIMCAGESNRTQTLADCDELMRRFGAPSYAIRAAYGLSETCSACFYNLESPQYDLGNPFASAGKHLPGVMEMKLVQDDSEETDRGVVYLRGDVILSGYYNNLDATAACMTDDGWFNTGDIGRVDENGSLHLLGRSKEILILHGNNYSSFELEYAIETSNIAGLTVSYTAVFSTWDESQQSEAVVVLFNPSEEAIGRKRQADTLQAIHRVVFNFCSQRALHVIPLPKALLPKSTIGKLSRSKLKKQYEAGAFDDYWFDEKDSHVQGEGIKESVTKTLDEVTPLEREIATVYAAVVGLPAEALLTDDALLSSGINSIGFLKVKRTLEKNLDMDHEIPMATLVQCHSVSDLAAELIKSGTTSAEYDPIVPLVKKGTKQPIFLLHPGAGEFLCWFNLLEYLPDRRLYAVRCKGLHSGEETFTSLQHQLDTYYAAIRRTQPEGPYLLLGYCLGGLLAFELAKMFEANGLEVAFCGGIDNPPDIRRSLGHEKYRSVLSDFLPALTGMSPEEAQDFTKSTAYMEDPEFYEAIYGKFPPAVIQENGGLTIQRIKAYGKVEDWHRAIAAKYEAQGKVRSLDIFKANALPLFDVSGLGSWDAVMEQWCTLAESPRIHKVQGNHYTVLKKPDIEVLQERINEALDARGV
ncbi:hypothetical protein M409DRAFT_63705 [Zasmidium cellare ATCC 36951]|uniref:Carrier domain-containing protein n=1 Tax=Zasmidium cellare ATCC 36951 TaxID=1080233 RepID=A0A6A6CZ12_ZASCE|nr:uncharacterized protein M409DRAFT_63705 [Zasmidium cellare ATCC 36951]KAF2171430.1 hypothetical protein M409DRAFT_63705 [Zasmidium cellare ATCC 36951]